MKRTLWALALAFALALPARAKTTTYQDDQEPKDHDASNAANWSNGLPVDGDTIDIAADVTTDPTTPISGGGAGDGATYHFAVTDNVNWIDIEKFIDRNAPSDVIGNVSVSASKNLKATGNIGGTLTATGNMWLEGNVAVTLKITVAEGGVLDPEGVLSANGGMDLGGNLYLDSAGDAVDTLAPIAITSNTAVIDWGSGNGDILGGIDAGVYTLTHSNLASGNSLTCNVAGNLNLGGDAALLAVDIRPDAPTLTATADANIYSLTMTSGTFDGNSKTFTVGEGGFTFTNGTQSGTLNVESSGNVTYTAGTVGTLNLVMAASKNLSWTGPYLASLTVNNGVTATATANLSLKKLGGSGTLSLLTRTMTWSVAANDSWTFTGSLTATTGKVTMAPVSDYSNAVAVNMGTVDCLISGWTPRTFTASAGWTSGDLTIYSSNTAGHYFVLSIAEGQSFEADSVTLGAAASNRSGQLVLRGGAHAVSGAIAGGGNGGANAITFGGTLRLGGTFAGTTIAVSTTGGEIDCGGAGKVTAVTATGARLVVRRAIHSTTGIPLRGWQDDSCTNVRFLGRRVVGESTSMVMN